MAGAVKVAGFVPMSPQVIGDAGDTLEVVRRDFDRLVTALFFDESWHSPRGEMERFEFGRVIRWDEPVEDEDEWEW